jgi:hypothetical protein
MIQSGRLQTPETTGFCCICPSSFTCLLDHSSSLSSVVPSAYHPWIVILPLKRNHRSRRSRRPPWRWPRPGSWARPACRPIVARILGQPVSLPFVRPPAVFPNPGSDLPPTWRISAPAGHGARPRVWAPPSGCGARHAQRWRGSGCSCVMAELRQRLRLSSAVVPPPPIVARLGPQS